MSRATEALTTPRDVLREGRQRCPAHEDRNPSLYVTRGRDGRWLLHCFAGCLIEKILAALQLTWSDLFPEPRPEHRAFARPRRLSPEEEVLRQEQRNRARLTQAAPLFRLADEIKATRDAAEGLFEIAATLPDEDGLWDLVVTATDLRREGDRLEAEQDELMRTIR